MAEELNCPQNLQLDYKQEKEKQNETKNKSINKNKISNCEKPDSSPVMLIALMALLIVALFISLAANFYLNRLLKEYLSIE
jgi:hypothetical protein